MSDKEVASRKAALSKYLALLCQCELVLKTKHLKDFLKLPQRQFELWKQYMEEEDDDESVEYSDDEDGEEEEEYEEEEGDSDEDRNQNEDVPNSQENSKFDHSYHNDTHKQLEQVDEQDEENEEEKESERSSKNSQLSHQDGSNGLRHQSTGTFYRMKIEPYQEDGNQIQEVELDHTPVNVCKQISRGQQALNSINPGIELLSQSSSSSERYRKKQSPQKGELHSQMLADTTTGVSSEFKHEADSCNLSDTDQERESRLPQNDEFSMKIKKQKKSRRKEKQIVKFILTHNIHAQSTLKLIQ